VQYVSDFLIRKSKLNKLQYSGKENDHLELAIDNNIKKLVQLIKRKYLANDLEYTTPMDFAQKAQFLTLDIATDLAFGKSFGYLESDQDVYAYIEKTSKAIPMMIFLGIFPWLNIIVQSPLLRTLLPSEKDTVGLGKVIESVLVPIIYIDRLNIFTALPVHWSPKDSHLTVRIRGICLDPSFAMALLRRKLSLNHYCKCEALP